MRLAEMPSSLPNPLVSTYARAFLCRIAMRHASGYRDLPWKCFNDCLSIFPVQQVTSGEEVNSRELCVFGERLLENSIADETRRIILKNCWRRAMRLENIQDFVECAAVWIEFAVRYFTLNELSVMLELLIKRVTPGKVCFLKNFTSYFHTAEVFERKLLQI
ncbi:unnamed protein product [Gongylonema pulchrum]|uniref:Uncharacterized protein n=1 Tax=Gongylonema pulchrum TaxID=637853 RepID=A0A183D2V7_9BILA|nr:unnamed protein product [Gongylonema pulchrum]